MSALRRHPDNGALRRRHLSTPGRRPPRGCRNLWKVPRRKPDERRRRGRSPRSPRPLPSRRRRGSRNRPRACAHPGPLLAALALVACSLTLLVVASLLARVALLAGLTGGATSRRSSRSGTCTDRGWRPRRRRSSRTRKLAMGAAEEACSVRTGRVVIVNVCGRRRPRPCGPTRPCEGKGGEPVRHVPSDATILFSRRVNCSDKNKWREEWTNAQICQ